ncbi:uncharacterized protein LOC120358481 [Solenopsis invicta]|uniref:uncharacterized protein LOC120358481 n=1 Tax=Solenopsis invicta TaxID=13686 RepID=UPI00193E9628|nr:uncharacterized protein LOC120358481 [Solenopsis invicta]
MSISTQEYDNDTNIVTQSTELTVPAAVDKTYTVDIENNTREQSEERRKRQRKKSPTTSEYSDTQESNLSSDSDVTKSTISEKSTPMKKKRGRKPLSQTKPDKAKPNKSTKSIPGKTLSKSKSTASKHNDRYKSDEITSDVSGKPSPNKRIKFKTIPNFLESNNETDSDSDSSDKDNTIFDTPNKPYIFNPENPIKFNATRDNITTRRDNIVVFITKIKPCDKGAHALAEAGIGRSNHRNVTFKIFGSSGRMTKKLIKRYR